MLFSMDTLPSAALKAYLYGLVEFGLLIETVAKGIGSPFSSWRTALKVPEFCADAIDKIDITPIKSATILLKYILNKLSNTSLTDQA